MPVKLLFPALAAHRRPFLSKARPCGLLRPVTSSITYAGDAPPNSAESRHLMTWLVVPIDVHSLSSLSSAIPVGDTGVYCAMMFDADTEPPCRNCGPENPAMIIVLESATHSSPDPARHA